MARDLLDKSRFSRLLVFLVCASLAGWASPAKRANAREARAVVFYVSTTGDDAWSGTLDEPNVRLTDGPFATLARARDAIRALRHSQRDVGPVTVYVKGGLYELDQPLVFAPIDSGTSAAPVTYAAYPSEAPILSGGRRVSGWRRYEGAKLDSVAGRLWVTHVRQGADGWGPHQLFVNGERRVRARTPNEGSYFHMDGQATSWPNLAQFAFHAGDVHAPLRGREVELITLQTFADTRMLVRSVDEASRTITLNGRFGPYGLERDARYWVENTIDALDSPGEWYFDRAGGLIYYYPLAGEDVAHAEIVAPRLAHLIEFDGGADADRLIHDVRLSGLTFSYTDWSLPAEGHAVQGSFDVSAAVDAAGAQSCSMNQCRFVHLGGAAVAFGAGSRGNQAVGNEMSDLGAGGVTIGTNVVEPIGRQTSHNQITDNVIHDIGRVFPSAHGIWVGQSADNVLAHNDIFDTYFSGISVGGTHGFGPSGAARNLVQFNRLHDIGRGLLSDLGCIYTLGVQPGTVVSNNLCHDVSRYLYGGWGLYLDDGSSDIVIEDNVVHSTQDGGLVVSGNTQDNNVRNNVFAFGRTGQLWRAGPTSHLVFTRNIVFWTGGKLLNGWTSLAWRDRNLRFDDNLYYCPGQCVTNESLRLSDWLDSWRRSSRQDAHSLIADPLFTDPMRGDFSIGAGSPISKIGFRPIDLSTVGPRSRR